MPMFDDTVTTALSRAMDGVMTRQRVNADNIANAMTPGYRARQVQFEAALASAVRSGRPEQTSASVTPTGDAPREDGNNVELEKEHVSLLQSGVQYQALAQAAAFKHSILRTAIRGQ